MVQTLQGAPRYVLQTFRSDITLDPAYQETHPFTGVEMEEFRELGKKYVKECLLR
jgi:hypothetical protein